MTVKKIKKYLKILSLALALAALLAVCSLPQAEEYSVPTLYIDNRAWHMYSLFPLTEQNGAYLVPSSFFGAVDGVEITYDDTRSCLLVQYGDSFISVNTKTLNARLWNGEVKKTTVSLINDEYFIDSALCAQALGFTIEVAEFFEKTVLRIKTQENLLDFATLVERNRVSQSAIPDRTDAIEGIVKRQEKSFSFVADFTKMSSVDQASFNAFLAENSLSSAIIISTNNLEDSELLKNVIGANALGCSFIIRQNNTAEVSECNDLLGRLTKNRTRLVLAPESLKVPLDAIGYIPYEPVSQKIGTDLSNFEFSRLTTVEITNFTQQTKSKAAKWIDAAEKNDVFIRALCPRTGN